MLLQGITAHYLAHGVYQLGEGASCLITAGAGGNQAGSAFTQLINAMRQIVCGNALQQHRGSDFWLEIIRDRY